MDFSKIFDDAIKAMVNNIINRRFIPQSEADIQAIIFHLAILLMPDSTKCIEIHVEPTMIGLKPDLVLGQMEVFAEIKFTKTADSNALRDYRKDIDKLQQYKKEWPDARCVFLAIDETGRLSGGKRGRSVNFFDPSAHELRGQWATLTPRQNILIADL